MNRLAIPLCFLLFSAYAFATTFVPLTIKEQIKDSDGIIYGEVQKITAENSRSGIVTKALIVPYKWMGDYKLSEKEVFEVYFPGGKFGNIVSRIEGAPELRIGEKLVLLTKNKGQLYWINNLGLGKFSLVSSGSKKIMINQIYPNRPEVGQIELRKFLRLASRIKQKKFHERFKHKNEREFEKTITISNEKKASRFIASVGSIEKKKEKEVNKWSAFWLIILLGVLGAFMTLVRTKKG